MLELSVAGLETPGCEPGVNWRDSELGVWWKALPTLGLIPATPPP